MRRHFRAALVKEILFTQFYCHVVSFYFINTLQSDNYFGRKYDLGRCQSSFNSRLEAKAYEAVSVVPKRH